MSNPSTTRPLSRRSMLHLSGAGLAAGLLAACNGNSNGNGNGNGDGQSEPTDDPTEVSSEYFWAGRPAVLNQDPFTVRKAQEIFGLDLTTISVSSADYGTRLQSLLVGGDIPDLMWIADPDEVQRFVQQGVIGELPREVVAEHAPNLSAGIEERWPVGWNYGFVDGRNYGIPTYYSGHWSSTSMWRGDLLDAAGVSDVPTTLEAAEEAFAALKEIGVIGMTSVGPSYFAAFHTIFAAHGVLPTAWQLADGNIINGAVHDGAREALELLHRWYREGYIDPEFTSGESGAQVRRLIAGEVAFNDYGAANAKDESNPNSVINTARSTNPDARLEFIRPLEGPAGRGAWSWGNAGNTYAFSAELVQDTGRLAAALEAFDAIYADEELSLLFAIGEEGTHYELPDPEAGVAGGITWLGEYTDAAAREGEGLGPYPFFGIPQADLSTFIHTPNPELRAEQEAVASDGIVDYFGKATVVPGANTYWANLTNLKVTAYAEFITGTRSLSNWDGFVTEWNSAGGGQLQAAAEELVEQLD